MNLIDQLKLMNSLSASEELLCQFIINEARQFLHLNKSDLMKKLNISSSTLYRFCNKLNIKGFDQLKLQIALDFLKNERNNDTTTVNYNYPFEKDDSLETISMNLLSIYEETSINTFKAIDFNELEKAIHILKRAENICLMTSNTNTLYAEKFGIQLKEIGRNVWISSSPYKWKLETVNLTSKDALIINSYAGQSSKSFINILPNLVKKGVPIILIGSTHNKSFMPYATSKLLMFDREDPKEKIYSFSTNVSTQYLFDVLYAAIYQDNYDKNMTNHNYIYE
ncbi:MAG: hypothetical protein CVU96_01290 [Firmicutes bacterium HGW-Firmicutes-20]|nr:MAG: hypothetical protein CVU96_01290 [Firmicutes bacterium HGW-Firmicutes-20]PKM86925.1 MAG: hypothetical protein CVU85_06855 [Firmicutes bacterium HGW-Firmicutes-10]